MDLFERNTEPQLATRLIDDEPELTEDRGPDRPSIWLSPARLIRVVVLVLVSVVLIASIAFFGARKWLRDSTRAALPQIDGSLTIAGLNGPVTVQRDAHGVPHIHAGSMDDLLVAQGYVTASDRLFQMDALRRHAAGELSEIFGQTMLNHDRLQRTLQIRASADRAVAALPPDQLHQLERYAAGVNASIEQQSAHLPIEFRILRYRPAPWTPRDSVLVGLAMFQDLTNKFPSKLAREALVSRLPPELEADLAADLYPVGSWRDHPPTSPVPDLSQPGPPVEDIPLDESQSKLERPASDLPQNSAQPTFASLLASVRQQIVAPADCESCTPGSNNWVVSGAHTASGKPLLSNDMHLAHTIPGIWYESDLEAPASATTGEPFHVAGVTIPGLPYIIVGHNAHIAWGITNLEADVQDVYVETIRNNGRREEFRATDGTWQPVVHLSEPIKVGGKSVGFDVACTRHGDVLTPILNPTLLAGVAGRTRALALRWTLYDPQVLQLPFAAVDAAHDWTSFLAAFSTLGGPPQNVVYADDQGHIGFHAMGKIPLRGAPSSQAATDLPDDITSPVEPRPAGQSAVIAANPNPLNKTEIGAPLAPTVPQLSGPISPVPFIPTAGREWTGYIPFDQLPQVFDPPGGVIATANARTTPDDYKYPITLNWAPSYRTERIWHLLSHRTGMTAADMLPIQSDVYSDFDHVLAQRLAYALDHGRADKPLNAQQTATLKQAADLLRSFNGRMTSDSSAAAIVASVHAVLWPMLLEPQLKLMATRPQRPGAKPATQPAAPASTTAELNALYVWGEKDYALEQVLMHTPPRWLPKTYVNWDDFLTAAIERGLTEEHAPADLSKWHYGAIHTLDIEHPIFDQSPALTYVFGLPTGTGNQPQSGDGTTIKQVGHAFGPSERFTADLADPDRSLMNIVSGQSGNPTSPWFLDQFQAWYHGSSFPFPFRDATISASTTHTLTLTPRR